MLVCFREMRESLSSMSFSGVRPMLMFSFVRENSLEEPTCRMMSFGNATPRLKSRGVHSIISDGRGQAAPAGVQSHNSAAGRRRAADEALRPAYYLRGPISIWLTSPSGAGDDNARGGIQPGGCMKTCRIGLVVLLCAPFVVLAQDGMKGAKRPGPIAFDEFNDRPAAPYKRGGELTVAVTASFRNLDPYQDTSATTSESIHGYVEEGLIGTYPDTWGNQPLLAETWDIE